MANISNSGTANRIIGIDTSVTVGYIGPGYIPIGSVIPVATNVSGSTSIGSGTVLNGWILANGQSIPGGQTLTGTAPNISNSRFIRGNTTSGGTGGAATFAMTTTQLPSHSHDSSHAHSDTFSVAVCAANPSHTHSSTFSTTITTGNGSTEFHRMVHQTGSSLASNHNPGVNSASASTSSASGYQNQGHTHGLSISTSTGSTSVGHGHGISTNSSTVCNTGTSSTGGAGSSTAYGILPLYISSVYMMRVS